MLIAGLMVGLGAQAESERSTGHYYSGNKLSEWCKDDKGVNAVACHAYITGVVDAVGAAQGTLNIINKYEADSEDVFLNPMPSPCIPSNVSSGQMVKIVIKHLNQFPAQLHHGAAEEVYIALDEAFPCPWE